jgi:hypothetical protein
MGGVVRVVAGAPTYESNCDSVLAIAVGSDESAIATDATGLWEERREGRMMGLEPTTFCMASGSWVSGLRAP